MENVEKNYNSFQIIDFKKHCSNRYYYADGFHEKMPITNKCTWKPTLLLQDALDYDYAYIWSEGKNLTDCCPDDLKNDYEAMANKFKAFFISFEQARLKQDDVCFFDSLPVKFLKKWCELKNSICESVLETDAPLNYKFQKELAVFLEELKSKELNLNWQNLSMTSKKASALIRVRDEGKNTINYNQFGTVTGRLSTNNNSFPILTIDKANRKIITPNNDLFLELDFNSAELRTLLSLTGKKQPEMDIHAWIKENIYANKYERSEVKEKVFKWLYNPSAQNKKLNSYFERDKIVEKYFDGESITNPFSRKIKVDKRRAVNYLIQSTTNDLVLRQALKIHKFLKETNSFIAFTVHDSVVIDIHRDDRTKIEEMAKMFSETSMGTFKTNLSLGKNFGDMRQIQWQQ